MMNLEVLFVPYPVKNAQGEYEVVVSDAMVLIHFINPAVKPRRLGRGYKASAALNS